MPREMIPKLRQCAVSSCRENVDIRRYWSPFCPTHALRSSRYGSPTGVAPTDRELSLHRRMIRDGLRRWKDSRPVRAALEVAEEILGYHIEPGRAGVTEVAQEWQRLRDGGVTPMDVLQRTAEVYALMLLEERFDDERELHAYLARSVQKLAKRHSPSRPTAHCRRTMAYQVKEGLQLFSFHLVNRLERDEVKKRLRRDAMLEEFD